jgi:hypothetical protein
MDGHDQQVWDRATVLREMLGFLNFSEGKPDPRFQRNISDYFRETQTPQPWNDLRSELQQTAERVRGTSAAFRDLHQAQAVVDLVCQHLIPAYRAHHADLLFHLSDQQLIQPFLLASMFEAVLSQRGPWHQADRIMRGAIDRLNDFVGHRPVAVLERTKVEPYEHERVRPIPLYIRGAGVAAGKYHDIVTRALDILAQTNREILAEAQFNLQNLDELALDPRAYDYSHPVHQRPNYLFGEWDPHCIDNAGNYRRFVARQVTLDALLDRVQLSGLLSPGAPGFRVQENASRAEPRAPIPEPSSLFEAAAVFAGTVLMAAGTSGAGPDAYDSSVTLATLVPRIARYRDQFYAELMQSLPASASEQLRRESEQFHQPFAGARQHLNRYLSQQRAAQLQNVRLAALFGSMGYPQASSEYSRRIPAPSARIHCEIDGLLSSADSKLKHGAVADALQLVTSVEDWIRRGIACGALADPWNILGFQGQFSIFAAKENSVPDPRVEQLTALMELVLAAYSRVITEAASGGYRDIERQAAGSMQKLAAWWDKYATTEVGGVRRVHGGEMVDAATHVARALTLWHQNGESAGDIKFWRQHCDGFNSPRAYSQVVHALIAKGDHVASLALLISWISRSNDVALEHDSHSFFQLAVDWLRSVSDGVDDTVKRLGLTRKFFDYLESNAEEYWQVPGLDLEGTASDRGAAESDNADDDSNDGDDVYAAAYDGVSYRDSAADGQEGEVMEQGHVTGEFPLEWAAERIENRLRFLKMLASAWKIAAGPSAGSDDTPQQPDQVASERVPVSQHPERPCLAADLSAEFQSWLRQLQHNQRGLASLLNEVQEVAIPQPLGSHESLIEYDHRRSIKEQVVALVIDTIVQTNEAMRRLLRNPAISHADVKLDSWERMAVEVDRALSTNDTASTRTRLPQLLSELGKVPILYRRWDRGGHPREIVAVRKVQNSLRSLVETLPRCGLLRETYHVLRAAHDMERNHPLQGEVVTEFDHLFRAAFRAVIDSVLSVSRDWPEEQRSDEALLQCLESLSEPFVRLWLEYSQTLRLSSIERVSQEFEWQRIRQFIEAYGHDLLTPRFLTPGNLRSVANQGTARYLELLSQDADPLKHIRLLDNLDVSISRKDAAKILDVIVQVLLENHEEYTDYNTTTTQSDYGERFFILVQFLRLKSTYERTLWNLQPIAIVHEALARHHRMDAAHAWHEALDERCADTAGRLMHDLEHMEKESGIRLATIRDRIGNRFTRLLAVDRARALVGPAMEQTRANPLETSHEFECMCEELQDFLETQSGIGLEAPRWLRVLEAEVWRIRERRDWLPDHDSREQLEQQSISRTELARQLSIWDDPL